MKIEAWPKFRSSQYVFATKILTVKRSPISVIFTLERNPGAVYAYANQQLVDKPKPRKGMYFVFIGKHEFTFISAKTFERQYSPVSKKL